MADHPPIILASGSQARQQMLKQCGLDFNVRPADIDEAAIIGQADKLTPSKASEILALEKAKAVSHLKPDALVIGSDQVLDFEGEIVSKAGDKAAAREKLMRLRGKTHHLHSAVCVCLDGKPVFTAYDKATLTIRDFDDVFLDHYMDIEADALTSCVGAYKIEGGGAWLFSEVEGDTYTIMGMPIFPLLGFLYETYGVLPCKAD